MRKSSRRSVLGLSSRRGAVTIIEAPVARSYFRRAAIAFFVTVGVVGLLAGTVISAHLHPIIGFVLGALLGAAAGLVLAVLIVMWPILRAFWHWSVEIMAGLAVVYGWTALMSATSSAVALAVLAAVVGVPAAIGPIRRRVTAVAWCVIVRHRLRMCFASFIATNRQGSLPLILLARPTPAGERVWVWLRPGLSIKDLEVEGQTQKLAVACWANEVRVMRASRRYAALIRVDITRREPLAHTIVSPLPGYVPDNAPTVTPAEGMPGVGLDLPDVPDEADEPEPATSKRKPRNPTPPTTLGNPNGFDPSDYA